MRRIELDVDVLLLFVDVEDLPEGLIAAGVHLNADLALWDRWDLGFAVLVGTQFESCAYRFTELHDRTALDEAHHHGSAFDGLSARGFDRDIQLGHVRRTECQGRQKQCRDQEEAHNPDYKPRWYTKSVVPAKGPTERGRTGFDGIESWWGGVPGSELP